MKRWSKEIDDYLVDLLGKQVKKELAGSLDHGETIVICGNCCTGKTTLMSILKSLGYNAVEVDNVYEIELTKPLESQVRNLDSTLLNSTEMYPKLCWIPVSDRLPEKGKYDWVLVKTDLFGGSGVPHVAEFRNGIWYSDCCDGPMEETLGVKVVAWFDMQTIQDSWIDKFNNIILSSPDGAPVIFGLEEIKNG